MELVRWAFFWKNDIAWLRNWGGSGLRYSSTFFDRSEVPTDRNVTNSELHIPLLSECLPCTGLVLTRYVGDRRLSPDLYLSKKKEKRRRQFMLPAPW